RHWDVEPDIVVMAKGIASGLPLSGILARRNILDRLPPGTHGGTYGGNVVACAAANATLDVIEDESLLANARERGAQFLAGRAVPGGARATGGGPPGDRGAPGGGADARRRVRHAGGGRRRGPRPGPAEGGPGGGPGRELDRPARRHVRERDPGHPAARDDGRR